MGHNTDLQRMKIKVKSRRVMGENIALHGLLPLNELPIKLRGRIPRSEIWVRADWADDPVERRGILIHELEEIKQMLEGMYYKKAHRWASAMEGFWLRSVEGKREGVVLALSDRSHE